MKRIDLDQMKRIEFELLKQFALFCERNGLRYYLSAGTLLGAVRHQGFIPWDDDIDLTMPRPDYERVFDLFPREFAGSHIKLTSYRDKSSIYPFIKIIDSRTIVYEKYVSKEYSTGVWIDVFPIDGIPNDGPFEANDKAKRIYDVVTADPSTATTPFRKFAKRALKPLYGHRDIYAVAKQLDETAAANPIVAGETVAEVVWGYGPREKMPYSILEQRKLTFEGESFDTHKNYDLYLTGIFGDYMTPPPENERIAHEFEAFWKDGAQGDE